MYSKHKHLIIGGGFGGLRVAKLLANRDDIEITIVSPQANFEYHGSLYRSANGYSPLETVIPYREIFENTNIIYIQDFMVDINPQTRRVQLLSGRELSYDSITLALGYEPEYFGIPGMREFSKTLYCLADALELRKSLKSVAEINFNKSALTKVIVAGGGPTGIETAVSVKRLFELVTGDSRVDVTLVEAQSRILSSFNESISYEVENRISESVDIRCNQKVIRATKDNLYIADQSPLPFDVLIWTAGSSANGYFKQRSDIFEIDNRGRVIVNDYLMTKYDNIYVIGDSASVKYSGTAYAAIEMGSYVASHIISKIDNKHIAKFTPSSPNYAIPTGPDSAVGVNQDIVYTGSEGWEYRRKLDLDALLLITTEEIARPHWEKGENIASLLAPRD